VSDYIENGQSRLDWLGATGYLAEQAHGGTAECVPFTPALGYMIDLAYHLPDRVEFRDVVRSLSCDAWGQVSAHRESVL
jgi:hypothetical protein